MDRFDSAGVLDGVFKGQQKQVGCFMRANVEDQSAYSIFVPASSIHKYTNIH